MWKRLPFWKRSQLVQSQSTISYALVKTGQLRACVQTYALTLIFLSSMDLESRAGQEGLGKK